MPIGATARAAPAPEGGDSLRSGLLIDGFLASSRKFPDNIALDVASGRFTYRDVSARAHAIADDIARVPDVGAICGVIATPDIVAYAGILGVLLSGRAYLPLNPSHPVDRIARIIRRSGLTTLIVDAAGLSLLPALERDCPELRHVIVPPAEPGAETRLGRLVGAEWDWNAKRAEPGTRQDGDSTSATLAYVLFTSGSTGEPKGVCVTNGNVVAYVTNVRAMIEPMDTDRFAQSSDLTFDLSVHPIWLAWECGGSLCVIPERERLAPAAFIKSKGITFWTSVPSVVTFLKRLHLLEAGSFPTIRHSMFCGEALTVEQAMAWQEACPNSVVDNFYGPTEATCAITGYRCSRPLTQDSSANGVIAIGAPFEGQTCLLVDSDLKPLGSGESGELLLAGSQVSAGYLHDPATTATRFITLPGMGDVVWYRTGDIVAMRDNGYGYFVGRVDNQVQIRGYRVEMQEIESIVRETSSAESVACVPWPVDGGTAQGVECFVTPEDLGATESQILKHCRAQLPSYMVPSRIRFLPALPLSANGKIDRKKLAAILKETGK
jgi:amino acid adenylation domain-containing protein